MVSHIDSAPGNQFQAPKENFPTKSSFSHEDILFSVTETLHKSKNEQDDPLLQKHIKSSLQGQAVNATVPNLPDF